VKLLPPPRRMICCLSISLCAVTDICSPVFYADKSFLICSPVIFRKSRQSASLPRDAMHKRGTCQYAVSVRLSVRLSVSFLDHVKTNKPIFAIVSPSGSHIILVLPHQTGWRYSDGNPHNGGVECKGV